MSLLLPAEVKLFLYLSPVDMRKSFNGLTSVVTHAMRLDPTSGHLFLFRNKRCNRFKILYVERDCFTLWYRRLERGKFYFPESREGHLEITTEQFYWILNSFDHARLRHQAHKNFSNFY
jgi:transposase